MNSNIINIKYFHYECIGLVVCINIINIFYFDYKTSDNWWSDSVLANQ